VTEVTKGVADFSGVAHEDVLKVVFALGIAWGQMANKFGAE
jgi:hypothetical protein